METRDDRALMALRKWAVLLDSAFQLPGTKLRFGLDPLIGLLPGGGDLVTGFFSVMIVLHAVRLRIPKVIIARMVFNSAIDMLTGTVPVLGDLVDFAWKANVRNLGLLERHAQPGVPPTQSDYVFVAICVAVLVLLAVIPLVLMIWLFSALSELSSVRWT
jgi:Domain of unknown function (DUF4112)